MPVQRERPLFPHDLRECRPHPVQASVASLDFGLHAEEWEQNPGGDRPPPKAEYEAAYRGHLRLLPYSQDDQLRLVDDGLLDGRLDGEDGVIRNTMVKCPQSTCFPEIPDNPDRPVVLLVCGDAQRNRLKRQVNRQIYKVPHLHDARKWSHSSS